MIKSLVISCFCAVLFCSACTQNAKTNDAAVETKAADSVVYACPMHPDITSDKPGKCRICDMDLEIKK